MVCIYCGGKTQVSNSRSNKHLSGVWRRRHCLACGAVFTTHEAPDLAGSWRVAYSGSKRLIAFDRDKLLLSIYKSCAHRPSALDDARHLSNTVITKLAAQHADGLIPVIDIARQLHTVLNRFDKAAATHYAAYHASSLR